MPGRLARRPPERWLAGVYLALVALLLAPLAVERVRDAALVRLEAAVDAWDGRWTRRLERGEELVAAGRYEEAERALEALDRDFPAPHVKYARDRERERLLRALAASHAALDRKRRTLETLRRLVAFDPRNFENHFALATAAQDFGEGDEALAAFREVLRIHPAHLPSLRAVVTAHGEAGAWGEAVAAYERYLDAFALEQVTVACGEARTDAPVPVDGRWHALRLRLECPAGTRALAFGPPALAVRVVALAPPLRVGEPPAPAPAVARAPEKSEDGGLVLALPDEHPGLAEVRLEVRLFKPVDAVLWDAITTAYRNSLDWDGLARARERTPPDATGADGGGERT